MQPRDGRAHVLAWLAMISRTEDGLVELRAPSVGFFERALPTGARVSAGSVLGELEVLGRRARILAPREAEGLVVRGLGDDARARPAVEYGTLLYVLDPSGASIGTTLESVAHESRPHGGPIFRSPTSGRFYVRPSPDADPFVAPGDTITSGTTIGLLEVMKTFHRVTYAPSPAEGLPEEARVLRVLPRDGEDLERGAPILELVGEASDE